MLKKNDVIFYKKAFFLVTKTDKNYAHINMIRSDGIVLSLSQKILKSTNVRKIEGAKRRIKIELPFADVNDFRYKEFIKDAKRTLYNILTNKDVEKNKKYLRHLAMRSCTIQTKQGFHTLSTFCRFIGLKKPEQLYKFLAESILEDQKQREDLLEVISDKALNRVISNYMTFWECWHGHHVGLDSALETDFALYMDEFKRRESIPSEESE